MSSLEMKIIGSLLLLAGVGYAEIRGYDPDTLDPLRLDLMRLEGRLGSLSQENNLKVGVIMGKVETGLVDLQRQVAALAANAGGERDGTATGVGDHPSPDLYPLLEVLASRLNTVNRKMEAVAATKAEASEGWFDVDLFVWWQRTWNPLLSAFFLGWGVYASGRLHHKLLFLSLGCFFSPPLCIFVIVVYTGYLVSKMWRGCKGAVQGSWIGCCCPPAEEAERESPSRHPVRLLSARWLPNAIVNIDLSEPSVLESTRIERPLTFLGYVRSFFDPYVYVPVGHTSSFEAW